MKFQDADRELTEFFTSAVGLSACPFEPRTSGTQFEADVNLLKPQNTRAMALHVAAAASLAILPGDARRVLTLVYAPHGTGFGRLAGVEGPDLLAIALLPASGGGSFVRLAMASGRVLRAYARRYPASSTDPARLLAFLAAEAGDGDSRDAFFGKLRQDCEEQRMLALAVYEVVRVERVRRESDARRERKRLNEERFDATLKAKNQRDAERLSRRFKGAA